MINLEAPKFTEYRNLTDGRILSYRHEKNLETKIGRHNIKTYHYICNHWDEAHVGEILIIWRIRHGYLRGTSKAEAHSADNRPAFQKLHRNPDLQSPTPRSMLSRWQSKTYKIKKYLIHRRTTVAEKT